MKWILRSSEPAEEKIHGFGDDPALAKQRGRRACGAKCFAGVQGSGGNSWTSLYGEPVIWKGETLATCCACRSFCPIPITELGVFIWMDAEKSKGAQEDLKRQKNKGK